MYLFVLAPMFSSSGSEEIKRRKRDWNNWWKKNGDELTRTFRLHTYDRLGLAPGHQIRIGGKNPVVVRFPKEAKSLVQKGQAVRFCLLSALDRSDEHGIAARNDAAFVLIDGSGAFDFSNISVVLKSLYDADVVFGRRPEGNSGMAPWRKTVEDFEQFVLLDNIKQNANSEWTSKTLLPDGQAGCWGFWLRSLKDLPLTAPNYEIEFDMLASSLMSKLRIAFTPELKMKARGKSDFGVDADEPAIRRCMEKMRFIVHKLDLSPEAVFRSKKSFGVHHPEKAKSLPLMYTKALRETFSSRV